MSSKCTIFSYLIAFEAKHNKKNTQIEKTIGYIKKPVQYYAQRGRFAIRTRKLYTFLAIGQWVNEIKSN